MQWDLDPKKYNQDKYGITLNFAGEPGDAMFSVYDGHGVDGHSAATFAKKMLPQITAKYIRQKRVQKYMSSLRAEGKSTKGAWMPEKWPFLEQEELELCCNKSFLETNELMHATKSVSNGEGERKGFIHFLRDSLISPFLVILPQCTV